MEVSSPTLLGMADAEKKIHVPRFHMAGQAIENKTRELMVEWQRLRPEEFRAWPEHARRMRKAMANESGMWPETREAMFVCAIPQFIMLKMGQFLGTQNWMVEYPEAAEAVNRVMSVNKMNQTTGYRCDGDR